jgi:hypothetical protein
MQGTQRCARCSACEQKGVSVQALGCYLVGWSIASIDTVPPLLALPLILRLLHLCCFDLHNSNRTVSESSKHSDPGIACLCKDGLGYTSPPKFNTVIGPQKRATIMMM